MKRILVSGVLCAFGLGVVLAAEPAKKTRDEMVIDDRAALQENAAWIYNDLEKGFAEAERVKKPLMVIHRCIP